MSNSIDLLLTSLPQLLKGAVVTVELSLVAIAIGFLGGIIVGLLNCRQLRHPAVGAAVNIFVWMIRGTPLFVQVLIVYYAIPEVLGVSFSPFEAGIIALGLNSTAYVGEIVRGGIDAIPEGQWEAAYVLGLKPWKILQGIILPQMVRISLSGFINEATSLIKETSILMMIGVAELTKISKDIVARELDPMTIYLMAAAIYLMMVGGVTLTAQQFQKRWQQ